VASPALALIYDERATPPATSRQVSARAMSAGRSGAEPPLSPIALPTSRLVGSPGVGPAPHSLDRQDAPRRYGFDGLLAPVIAYLRAVRAQAKRTIAYAFA
jgi:hypothetical protein